MPNFYLLSNKENTWAIGKGLRCGDLLGLVLFALRLCFDFTVNYARCLLEGSRWLIPGTAGRGGVPRTPQSIPRGGLVHPPVRGLWAIRSGGAGSEAKPYRGDALRLFWGDGGGDMDKVRETLVSTTIAGWSPKVSRRRMPAAG